MEKRNKKLDPVRLSGGWKRYPAHSWDLNPSPRYVKQSNKDMIVQVFGGQRGRGGWLWLLKHINGHRTARSAYAYSTARAARRGFDRMERGMR